MFACSKITAVNCPSLSIKNLRHSVNPKKLNLLLTSVSFGVAKVDPFFFKIMFERIKLKTKGNNKHGGNYYE
jgi:hypothetical protein